MQPVEASQEFRRSLRTAPSFFFGGIFVSKEDYFVFSIGLICVSIWFRVEGLQCISPTGVRVQELRFAPAALSGAPHYSRIGPTGEGGGGVLKMKSMEF